MMDQLYHNLGENHPFFLFYPLFSSRYQPGCRSVRIKKGDSYAPCRPKTLFLPGDAEEGLYFPAVL